MEALKVVVPFDEGDLNKVGIANNTINNKGFKCNNCSRIYFYEHEYKLHLKLHKGEKAFMCNYSSCYRKFLSLDNLNYHIKMFHNECVQKDKGETLSKISGFLTKHTVANSKPQLNKKHKRVNPYDNCGKVFHISLHKSQTKSMKKEYQISNSCKQLCGIVTQGVPTITK